MAGNSKKTILIVINNLKSGGTQNQAVLYANRLSERYRVMFLVIRGFSEENCFFENRLNSSIKLYRIKYKLLPLAMIELLHFYLLNKYQLCVNFQPRTNLLSTFLSKIFNPKSKIICTIRGDRAMNYFGINLYGAYTDLFWVNSTKISERLSQTYGIDSKKIITKYNLVEPQGINFNFKEKYILHVGRIAKVKNQLELIEAFSQLPVDYKNSCELHFVGAIEDEAYYGVLMNRIQELKLKNIFFHPKTSNVETYYSKCDLLVLSSLSEGLPNVILEAQAYGIPVASSNVGDVSLLIDHTSTGYLYTSENSKELSECMLRYFSMSMEKKLNMRNRVFSRLVTFSEENNVEFLDATLIDDEQRTN